MTLTREAGSKNSLQHARAVLGWFAAEISLSTTARVALLLPPYAARR